MMSRPTGSQLCLKWNNHAAAFNTLLKTILSENVNDYSDSTILCHGKFYPVHRFVLATCSEYFQEMFQQCMNLNNKHPFIIVKDVHPEQMEALLSYMYKGEVNVLQENLPDLIKAAETFKIKGLAVSDDEFSKPKKRIRPFSSPSPMPKKEKCDEILLRNSQPENDNINISLPIATETPQKIACEVKTEPLDNIEEPTKDCILDYNAGTSNLNNDYKNLNEHYNFPPYQESLQVFDFDTSLNNFENEDEMDAFKPSPSTGATLDKILGSDRQILPILNFTATKSSPGRRKRNTGTSQNGIEKRHKCMFCPYMADLKGDLTRHLRIHTGEKPFNCPFCSYRATQKACLIYHMKARHSENKP